jgi:hypothetical protein
MDGWECIARAWCRIVDAATGAQGRTVYVRAMIRLVLVASLLVSTTASADPFSDALKEYSGGHTPKLVLDKLSVFKLGKPCTAKLPDKAAGALHAASYFTRDVAEYAKSLGDDWSKLETDEGKLAAAIEAFRAKFLITVTVEGDDCDAGSNSLWLRYWSGLATTIRSYPPPHGKVFVNLTVSSKARDVIVETKDNITFTITAPKDIEAKLWNDKLERPFRKATSGIAEDHVFNLKEATGRFASAWVLTKFTTFKLGKKCLASIGNKDSEFAHTASFATRDILEYVKAVGGDDWDAIEQQSSGDKKSNLALVDKSMDDWKKKLSITVSVEGDDCDAKSGSLWLKYWSQIALSLKNYPTKKKVTVVLSVTSKAKDVAISGGNGSYTITAPRDVEKTAWTDKFDAAFKKGK